MSAPPKGDLAVIHDYGASIELVIFAGGKEIARVPLDPMAALAKGAELVAAARRHLQRKV